MKQRILFVCLGNICRSCTAEEIFRTLVAQAGLAEQFQIDSAGLIDYHEGELPDSRMRQHALRHGYRLTHRSRPVTTADFSHFDLIVGMDEKNLRQLRRMAPSPTDAEKVVGMADYLRHHSEYNSVPDPYYGSATDFELAIELLEDACGGLLEKLTS